MNKFAVRMASIACAVAAISLKKPNDETLDGFRSEFEDALEEFKGDELADNVLVIYGIIKLMS